MMYNSVLIASTAGCLINTLKDRINDFNYRIITATTEEDLATKIKTHNPRLVFIENCFCKQNTVDCIKKIAKKSHDFRVIAWSVCETSDLAAARLVNAGADSFFCLRDLDENIDNIVKKIICGQKPLSAGINNLALKGRGMLFR